ncbi:MAG: metallophosphoesterase [Sulfuricaulis sp.]|uniref:metallophosphoesterase family protein n=1 Tax=Sulfuricaulis sp. TaxID=2003553 RepID=UPI0025D19E2B|nr:metallophosphoesterase [Sulfuricaulis sp.]MCR4347734.1 metallophosphoesterase [Sulfuricaulis sp.]
MKLSRVYYLLFLILSACATPTQEPQRPQEPARLEEAVLVGAGDIASCHSDDDEQTALLLDRIPGVVFAVGDTAYRAGSPAEFTSCYEPSWGRHKARTRPAVGNHEYLTRDAAGYFAYFGDQAGPPGRGYYSYDLAQWHIVVINSMLEHIDPLAQERWLASDLAAHPARCTLAYWHHPRFSSGHHGNHPQMRRIWKILYTHGADVVISGHDHLYERFASQTADGIADPKRGIRQFIAGTGGFRLYEFHDPKPNSEARNNTAFGVLKMTLKPGTYAWEFIAVPGVVLDSGEDSCH